MDLLHILLDSMTDFDTPAVSYIEKEVFEIEELVYLCDTNDEISRLLQVSRMTSCLFVTLFLRKLDFLKDRSLDIDKSFSPSKMSFRILWIRRITLKLPRKRI
jgi:Mg2+ and Co2+ transporter CorA